MSCWCLLPLTACSSPGPQICFTGFTVCKFQRTPRPCTVHMYVHTYICTQVISIYHHYTVSTFSCTSHSCVFKMTTVFISKAIVTALSQVSLWTSAVNFIQPSWSSALSKWSKVEGPHRWRVPELLAHNMCIVQVPTVITHCAPHTIMKYLNTPFMCYWSTNQTNSILWNWAQGRKGLMCQFKSHTDHCSEPKMQHK